MGSVPVPFVVLLLFFNKLFTVPLGRMLPCKRRCHSSVHRHKLHMARAYTRDNSENCIAEKQAYKVVVYSQDYFGNNVRSHSKLKPPVFIKKTIIAKYRLLFA